MLVLALGWENEMFHFIFIFPTQIQLSSCNLVVFRSNDLSRSSPKKFFLSVLVVN